MQLEKVLTDLNAALRCGDTAALSGLSAMLETVSPPHDRAALHRAARLAHENLTLAEASMRGVRAAARRLAELRAAPTLATYDQTGRRTERAPAAPGSKRI